MKSTKIIIAAITFFLLGVVACDQEDFLENENKTVLTDATQWSSEGNADIFLNDIYSEIPNLWGIEEQYDYYTDNYNISHYYTASVWRQGICQAPAISTAETRVGTQGPTIGFTYETFFKKLRKCNTFISKLNENRENFSDGYYNKRIDEVKFLRAFFYSEVFMNMGGMPIITEVMDRNEMSEDELRVQRGTFEETFNFIVSELETIVNNKYLQTKYSKGATDAGRVTLGSALALKGWIELFAASPLFNTDTPYLPDPGKYVHFGNYSKSRWETAAATNKKFIDEYGGVYSLFDEANFYLWRASNEYNSEVIWDRSIVANVIGSMYERRGGTTYVLGVYRCWGNYNPTQELVDAFCMNNGLPITDPESGYDPQHPYVNREKRFYDFIVYDGATYNQPWMGRSEIIYTRIDKVHPSLNEIDLAGKSDVGDSGYYQKKMLNPDANTGGALSGQNYVFYRYAEVLLNYAEAQNEAVGPDESVYNAINKIRKRGDLPDLQLGLSQDEMRDEIRRERRVELCFEYKNRYMDNKRWRNAEVVMNTPRHNMVIRNSVPSDNSGVWEYSIEPELDYTSKFELKQYMSPIPINVIDQNPKMVQNPGY